MFGNECHRKASHFEFFLFFLFPLLATNPPGALLNCQEGVFAPLFFFFSIPHFSPPLSIPPPHPKHDSELNSGKAGHCLLTFCAFFPPEHHYHDRSTWSGQSLQGQTSSRRNPRRLPQSLSNSPWICHTQHSSTTTPCINNLCQPLLSSKTFTYFLSHGCTSSSPIRCCNRTLLNDNLRATIQKTRREACRKVQCRQGRICSRRG